VAFSYLGERKPAANQELAAGFLSYNCDVGCLPRDSFGLEAPEQTRQFTIQGPLLIQRGIERTTSASCSREVSNNCVTIG
jgi:hypothetical protein